MTETSQKRVALITGGGKGIGAEVNMTFPLGSHLADVTKLTNAEANINLYREFGSKLCEKLDRIFLKVLFQLFWTPIFFLIIGG